MIGLLSILLAILGFFCAGDLCFAYCRNRDNKHRLFKALEEGTKPEINVLGDKLLPRPTVVNLLKNLFQPDNDQSFYYTICGEHGTGKTTMVRIASREVGRGVIYIDVPPNIRDFGEEFGKAINFAFEERVSYTKQLVHKLGAESEFISSLHFIHPTFF